MKLQNKLFSQRIINNQVEQKKDEFKNLGF
jgi:hypothetical protein